ncbi:MAG: metal-dependent hydrolase [Cyanobacteria bacterium J06559_3]
MPSPIAHSITGYAIAKIFSSQTACFKPVRMVVFLGAIFIANVADIDFTFQFLTHASLHRGPTHSIAALIVVALLLGWLSAALKRSLIIPTLGLAGCIYGSHLVLDFFTAGGSGLQLFWPISDGFWRSPLPLFPAVHHSRGLFDVSHLFFIAYELSYASIVFKAMQSFESKHRNPKLDANSRYDSSVNHGSSDLKCE